MPSFFSSPSDTSLRKAPSMELSRMVGHNSRISCLLNRPMKYDDQIVRQLLECVVADSKERITVIFKGGMKAVQPLTD